MNKKSKPKAVLISDTHYSLSTLSIADNAWRMAVDKAAELGVPLIDAGDLTNDKAILRAEVMNALIITMKYARDKNVSISCIVGNHSLINEKSKSHALEFLKPYVHVIDFTTHDSTIKLWYLPYFSDLNELKQSLKQIPKGSTIIMHQGVTKAHGGHYMHDKTAAPAEWFDGYRVISGHYHRRQDIKCGETGLFSYIGNPFSLTFGEASDPAKGFQILMDDGTLEFVPTNLRQHYIFERTIAEIRNMIDSGPEEAFFGCINKDDLVWLKITGIRSELALLDKKQIGSNLGIGDNFKLDLLPIDDKKAELSISNKLNDIETLYKLITDCNETNDQKDYLLDLVEDLLK